MNEDLQKLKLERDDYKNRFEELKIKQDIAEIIETLPSRYDRNRVKGLTDDSLEVFMLDKDEHVVTRSGKPAKDWIMAKADLFNFTVKANSGKYNSGSADAAKQKAAYEEAKANGDSLAMLNNLPI